MYNSSLQVLSQIEETKRLGLRGGKLGDILPHCLAMAVALCGPKPHSPGPCQCQGTGLGIFYPPYVAVPWGQVMRICPCEGGMGKYSQLRGTKPRSFLIHPHSHHGHAGQLPPQAGAGVACVPAQASTESWWDS